VIAAPSAAATISARFRASEVQLTGLVLGRPLQPQGVASRWASEMASATEKTPSIATIRTPNRRASKPTAKAAPG